jgi:hypothetical protein
VKFEDGQSHPLIFQHLGLENGLPRFREEALALNDFPTEKDRSIKRSGEFLSKMVKERKIVYTAPGPSGDFDNDGRLDFFLPSWWSELSSQLLRNETPGGHWLDVRVQGAKGVNRMGIGARVKVYAAGKLGDASALLGCQEISVGYGYASGQAAIAHFGLGDQERVDIEVILPHGRGTLSREDVKANQQVLLQ